jgi:hypothetical protein
MFFLLLNAIGGTTVQFHSKTKHIPDISMTNMDPCIHVKHMYPYPYGNKSCAHGDLMHI